MNRHRPRRRFAQHFLVDRGAIASIVDLVRPAEGEIVVEIGPGKGALTDALVTRLQRLVAVEIDRDLVAMLRERHGAGGLHLIEGDALGVDLGQVLRDEGGERLLLVGNLPYNITAPLLFHCLDHANSIDRAVVMVQREVARRLVAGPGSKDYGLLTVLVAMRAETDLRLQVDRRSFRPIPAVDSAVVELRFAAGPRFAVGDMARFDRIVRRAFGQRRKMLRNSLLGLNPQGGKAWLAELGRRADVELTRRPEELSIEEFVRLSDASGDVTT